MARNIYTKSLVINYNTLFDDFKNLKSIDSISSVEDLKDEFINFLKNYQFDENFEDYVTYQFDNFKEILSKNIHEVHLIKQYIEFLPKRKTFNFIKNYKFDFSDLDSRLFNEANISYEIILEAFSKYLEDNSTGIIIVGFDDEYNHPSYIHFKLIANVCGEIITEIDSWEKNASKTIILTFAEDDEISMFLNGINPELDQFIKDNFKFFIEDSFEDYLKYLEVYYDFDDSLLKKFKNRYSEFIDMELYSSNFIKNIENFKLERQESITRLCGSLPQNFLFDFAEFLIKLESSKKKFSLDLNNVSDFVDIVSIKKNNFLWIKSVQKYQF